MAKKKAAVTRGVRAARFSLRIFWSGKAVAHAWSEYEGDGPVEAGIRHDLPTEPEDHSALANWRRTTNGFTSVGCIIASEKS